jgi:hypothetical protein
MNNDTTNKETSDQESDQVEEFLSGVMTREQIFRIGYKLDTVCDWGLFNELELEEDEMYAEIEDEIDESAEEDIEELFLDTRYAV